MNTEKYRRIVYHVSPVINEKYEAVGWSYYSDDGERSVVIFPNAERASEIVNEVIALRMQLLDPDDTTTDFVVQCHWMTIEKEPEVNKFDQPIPERNDMKIFGAMKYFPEIEAWYDICEKIRDELRTRLEQIGRTDYEKQFNDLIQGMTEDNTLDWILEYFCDQGGTINDNKVRTEASSWLEVVLEEEEDI